MIGVSPAYFVSRFGCTFTAADVIASIPDIAKMGYQSFQLEAFHPDMIEYWAASGFSQVAAVAEQYNLTISQCVGHALLNGFTDEQTLFSDWGIEEAVTIAEGIRDLPCPVFTLPLPRFSMSDNVLPNTAHRRQLHERFSEKLIAIIHEVSARSKTLALEVLPGSLVGGLTGFLQLATSLEEIVTVKICCNFDTGHAHADNDSLPLIAQQLGSRIVGTHLCDNWGMENLSLRPGSAGIPWTKVISAMEAISYSGSYDVEIACRAQDVSAEYSKALSFLKSIISSEKLHQESLKG